MVIDVSLNVQFASISTYVILAKTATNIVTTQMTCNYFVILYILKQAIVNHVVINSTQRGVIHFMFTTVPSVYTMPFVLIARSYKDITTMRNISKRYCYETIKCISYSCNILYMVETSNLDYGL